MLELNKIYNEDCLVTMQKLNGVDCVLTSPPYNTQGHHGSDMSKYQQLYEAYLDNMTEELYSKWTCSLFEGFNRTLKNNGCVLWNISYSSKQPWVLWNLIADIQSKTNFIVADCIVWKKQSALPNNVSPNKLTRICEFVFVFCRKNEFMTFNCYKGVASERKNGQTMYKNVFNFIEAPNNDGSCPIHKATYSTELCGKLLLLYTKEGDVVYDPFMGTGTTAIACHRGNRKWIGSEISKNYCEYANRRIAADTSQLSLF